MASSSVAGKNSTISFITGLLLLIDIPKSPLTTPDMKSTNCAYKGLSKPRRLLISSTSSIGALPPKIAPTGSAGIALATTKTTTETPKRTMSIKNNLFMTNVSSLIFYLNPPAF